MVNVLAGSRVLGNRGERYKDLNVNPALGYDSEENGKPLKFLKQGSIMTKWYFGNHRKAKWSCGFSSLALRDQEFLQRSKYYPLPHSKAHKFKITSNSPRIFLFCTASSLSTATTFHRHPACSNGAGRWLRGLTAYLQNKARQSALSAK